jgi:hypothetical protein
MVDYELHREDITLNIVHFQISLILCLKKSLMIFNQHYAFYFINKRLTCEYIM